MGLGNKLLPGEGPQPIRTYCVCNRYPLTLPGNVLAVVNYCLAVQRELGTKASPGGKLAARRAD